MRKRRTRLSKKITWSSLLSVCHRYVLDKVISKAQGYCSLRENELLVQECSEYTYRDNIECAELDQSPSLAHRECSICIQLGFVYEARSTNGLYDQVHCLGYYKGIYCNLRARRMYRGFLPPSASSQTLT